MIGTRRVDERRTTSRDSSLFKDSALRLGLTIAAMIGVLACRVAGPESAPLIRHEELEAAPPVVKELPTLVLQSQIDDARPKAMEYRKLVLSDLFEKPRGKWAGTYAWHNGYEGRTFDLAPRGFVFEYRSCTGTGDLAYGDVTSVEGLRVHLSTRFRIRRTDPRVRPGRRSDFELEPELFSVPWGEERFLVPASLMPEFCAMAKATGFNSMEYSNYPRKVRGGARPLRHYPKMEGLPEVPAEFRHLLPE